MKLSTLVLLPFVAAIAHAGSPPSSWSVRAQHTLGGDGGWDLMAVDAATHRLFIARSTRVMVVDLDQGTTIGEITGLDRAHGVVLVPQLHRGYATSGGDDHVIAFNLDSLAVTDRIATGKNPDAIAYDVASKRVFVFNGRSNDATVIDAETNKVVATLALPGKPELAAGDGRGRVFVNLEDKGRVAVIDAAGARVETTWALASCEEPSGIAVDETHQRIFSVCANRRMVVLDAKDGRLISTLPIGEGPDGAAFDPVSANAFSSNSDGTLTVVHEDDPKHFHVAATVKTPPRSRTIVLDAGSGRVVLATGEFGAPPPPTAAEPHPRPVLKPGSFGIVAIGQH